MIWLPQKDQGRFPPLDTHLENSCDIVRLHVFASGWLWWPSCTGTAETKDGQFWNSKNRFKGMQFWGIPVSLNFSFLGGQDVGVLGSDITRMLQIPQLLRKLARPKRQALRWKRRGEAPFILLTFWCWDLMFDTNKMYTYIYINNLYCIESPFQKCKVDIAHGEKGCLDVLLPQWLVPSATGRRQRRQWGGKVEYFGCTVWWLSIITDLWWFMPWCHACFHLFPTFSANFQTFTGRRWLEALPKAECSWEHGYIVTLLWEEARLGDESRKGQEPWIIESSGQMPQDFKRFNLATSKSRGDLKARWTVM